MIDLRDKPYQAEIRLTELPEFEKAVHASGGFIAGCTIKPGKYLVRLCWPRPVEPKLPLEQPVLPIKVAPEPITEPPKAVLTHCNSCSGDYEGPSCPICSAMERAKVNARAIRREYAIKLNGTPFLLQSTLIYEVSQTQ